MISFQSPPLRGNVVFQSPAPNFNNIDPLITGGRGYAATSQPYKFTGISIIIHKVLWGIV